MVSKPVISSSISRSVSLISALTAAACGGKPEATTLPAGGGGADVALVGGDIWTMDPTNPRVTAVAWRGDENVAVRELASEAATVAVMAEAAKKRPAGQWLIGRGWDQNRWPGQQFPTRARLDAAIG